MGEHFIKVKKLVNSNNLVNILEVKHLSAVYKVNKGKSYSAFSVIL